MRRPKFDVLRDIATKEEELLASAPADKVMFRRVDGSAVTAAEMVKLKRDMVVRIAGR